MRPVSAFRVTVSACAVVVATAIWVACEDDEPTSPVQNGPPPVGLTDPVWEYPHSEGFVITGGYVYRGPSLPLLTGKYIFGDHGTQHIWALTYDGTTASSDFLVDSPDGVTSFGVAENGELFICGYNTVNPTKLRGLSETGGTYSLTDPFPNLTFNQPVDLQNAGDGTNRLFVVEQDGIIEVFANSAATTTTSEFLNISSRVECCGELGLLGLAFHPDFENNNVFFAFYTSTGGSPHRTRVSRFRVTGLDPDDADETSEEVLLEFNDRQGNHNGGAICFGGDGYLYIAIGDEGAGGDLYDNAQNRSVLFGKILRIDVNNATAPLAYAIPLDNPFVGNSQGFRQEIFAWGLRNPWRMTYDADTDRIWVGDVGQGDYEEIDIIESGKNYGWDCREGAHDYLGPPDGPSADCPQ